MNIANEYYDLKHIELANIDSLLVESGTELASMNFDDGSRCELIVCGDVSLEFNGDYYAYSSDYPKELADAIINGESDKYVIWNNNWVDYLYWDKDGNFLTDNLDNVDGFGNTIKDAKNIMLELKNLIDKGEQNETTK